MELKSGSSKAGVRAGMLSLTAALLLFSGCAGTRPGPVAEPEAGQALPEIAEKSGETDRSPDSRVAAAHSLIRAGYRLLQNQDYNGAIRMLERAVGVNPADGPGYFYLAEAWLAKGNCDRAARFNELAVLYLRGDRKWTRWAEAQKERIKRARAEKHVP